MAAPSRDPAVIELQEAVRHLTRAMWELHSTSDHLGDSGASSTLSRAAEDEIRAAADILGVDLDR